MEFFIKYFPDFLVLFGVQIFIIGLWIKWY